MNKAPCPKVSCSTPVGAKKGPGTKFPLIANRRPLPSWAKPTTICQGVTRSPRDCWTDNECFQPTRSGSSSGTNNESITTSPTSPTSPASPIPTALVENTSSIRTARSGLLKSSTRNSSFFLNDTRAENATTSEESEAGNVSTTRARPRLHTKLFHHDTSLSSNMNSPITPTSPQGGVNASPKTKQSTGSSHLPDVSQKKQEQEHVQAATADNSKPCKEQQASHQSKKKRICCKCNQPLRRSGNTKKGESSSRIGVPSATGNREDYAWYHYECLRCPVCDEHFTEKDYFVRHGQEVYHPKCRKAALNSSSGNSGIGKSQRQSNCTVCSKKIKTGSGGDGFDFDKGKYHFEV
ncbi:hypothetical protein BDB00DRAFT_215686 [Zychaea mexicana]|uniref:uncharacterized protein n=1 Tax=Zychaea mexicana TaxID=64656 RepID=UPI0022FE4937|nr:uncharacterized protein BDB00DRAFT_215686 [Zychaea mexicana]KAI9472920.1 hypothetical protein BDB00DRAFT_215686 [Zychaea mexicana]